MLDTMKTQYELPSPSLCLSVSLSRAHSLSLSLIKIPALNLTPYEVIISLTPFTPIETGKMVEIYGSLPIQNNKKQRLNLTLILHW